MSEGPYRVEKDKEGCQRCGAGFTWTVVDYAADTAVGVSYDDREVAEELADHMNMAYLAGVESTAK